MPGFPWLSLILIALFALFAYAGWRTGLIRRLLEFAGAIATVILAIKLGGQAAGLLVDRFEMSRSLAVPLGPLALLILGFLFSRLLAVVVSGLIHLTVLMWVDRLGGAVLGLITGIILSSLLLFVGASLGNNEALRLTILERPVPRWTHDVVPGLWRGLTGDELDPQAIRDRVEKIRDAVPALPLDLKKAATGGGQHDLPQ